MKVFNVTIRGTRPLLQHRFPEETAGAKAEKRTGPHDDSKEAELSLYRLPDGTVYQPAEHIEGALKQAAKDFRIEGKRSRSYSVLVQAQLEIQPRQIPHKIQHWVTDSRSVVLSATRGRIMRHRPRFDEWELEFQIIDNDSQIPVDVIRAILEHSGNHEGIGDYRPKYGRFAITKFDEVVR